MQIHHVDEGRGPAVLCVHGFPMDGRLWAGQQPLVREARLVRPDLPGFGRSPALPGATMSTYAEAVVQSMDDLELRRAVLCGLSMGGYVLFEVWRRFPERVDALVLCDTRADADSPQARLARDSAAARVRRGEKEAVIAELLPKLLAAGAKGPTEQLLAMARDASDEGFAAALEAMRDRPDSQGTLATIDVPTLVVVGKEDALTPPDVARSMAEAIQGAVLLEIPGAGHASPLEKPKAFNEALRRFLDGSV